MATTVVRTEGQGYTHRFTWASLAQNETGDRATIPGAADRVIQVFGTFGAAATVTVEGSCELTPTTWFPLTDMAGTAISFTTAGGAGGAQIMENVTHLRVVVAGGDGTTDLTAIMLARRTF
jgi:hypothetical protein